MIGTPREVYFKPANRFVAEFIGTVNTLKAKIEDKKLIFPGGSIPIVDIPALEVERTSGIEIYFRPEHAMVAKTGQGHLKATVLSSFFMGDRTRLIVNGETDEPLKVEALGRQSFDKGQTVDIHLDLHSLFTLTE